ERMPGIIEADDLTKTYNEIIAVSHIRFSVKKGEIFGFLGPNGAGKTTTMRMIECVSPRTSGALRVFDMDPDINPAGINSGSASSRRKPTLTRTSRVQETFSPMPGTLISLLQRQKGGWRSCSHLWRSPRSA